MKSEMIFSGIRTESSFQSGFWYLTFGIFVAHRTYFLNSFICTCIFLLNFLLKQNNMVYVTAKSDCRSLIDIFFAESRSRICLILFNIYQ